MGKIEEAFRAGEDIADKKHFLDDAESKIRRSVKKTEHGKKLKS